MGSGDYNTASNVYSVVIGGSNNNANGNLAVVIGGSQNKAGGDNAIAMGTNANAKNDRSFVINLLEDKEATSKKAGEFRVHSKKIVIHINGVEVQINKNNIQNFKNLLKNNNRRHLEQNNNNSLSNQTYTNSESAIFVSFNNAPQQPMQVLLCYLFVMEF